MTRLRLLLIALAVAAVFAGRAGAQAKPKDDAERRLQEVRQRMQQEIQQRALQAARQAEETQLLAVMAAQGGGARWSDQQFERWVFQQDQTADRARQRFESLLNSRVDDLERTYELTLTQVRKLRLAGRGDIKRFFDTYEHAKTHFQSVNNDAGRLQEVQPDVAVVRTTLQGGPFHEDSLLYKSLRHTLTEEQFAKYDAIIGSRRAFRHRANIELAVCLLEQAMPLTDAQRRGLIALLEQETSPPRKGGQYEAYLILHQIVRLPEAKLKPLLSDTQRLVLGRQLAQYEISIASLRQSGLISDEDLAELPAAAAK